VICVVAVDILVNNAGKGHSWFFEAVEDTSEFPKIADIDFWGNVRTASASITDAMFMSIQK
jgi:NAD(P)-dependent dehydrogenase (short-subunit alcohol dehydrogenase family)